MRLLVGIDDTDNLETRGTGYRARELGRRLAAAGLAQVTGITRHQLLVDDAIPYTSHNSAACLALTAVSGDRPAIASLCREYLLESAAAGADAGLCVADAVQAGQASEFGRAAQRRVLRQDDATTHAHEHAVLLEGLTGTRQGVIGALAAVGLHEAGDDGRYIWVRGLRELAHTRLRVAEVLACTGVERLATPAGETPAGGDEQVDLGPWPRPVRIGGRAVLLIERSANDDAVWQVLAKEHIKAFRP
ncbi:MAG: hypothetical protein IT495_00170 [Gammaproteobacteria bacterium]|nr:hypothetical protein [Gammaproteobacteria bacterium]